MGISDRCLRHPEHHQSAGVCPWCLRERLSRLSSSQPSSSSVATSLFDASSDTTASPSGSFGGRRAISMVLRGRKQKENLSRSHSVVTSARGEVVERRKKPKRGLWKILVGSMRRKASTVKNMKDSPSATTWVL